MLMPWLDLRKTEDFFDTKKMHIRNLIVDHQNPSIWYVLGDGGGVYKSKNFGETWDEKNSGLPSKKTFSLAMDPNNSSILFVGLLEGLYKSTNGGEIWKKTNSDNTQGISKIIIDISSSNNILVLANGILQKGDNNGDTFSPINKTLAKIYIEEFAVDPIYPDILYVAADKGIYKSINGGKKWKKINNGFGVVEQAVIQFSDEKQSYSEESSFDFIDCLRIDPHTTTTVYALGWGVYKTDNGGDRWFKLSSGLPRSTAYVDLAIDPKNPSTIYISTEMDGNFISIDKGLNWSPVRKRSW